MPVARLRLAQCALAVAALTAGSYAFSQPALSDDQRIICKQTPKSGSRFMRRLCGTKAEWERMTEQHKRAYSEIQNRPTIELRN